MKTGFYYDIYGPTMIGRAPSRILYSVSDQAEDAWVQRRKHEVQAALKARDYQERGMWLPAHPSPAVEVEPGAAIISTYI